MKISNTLVIAGAALTIISTVAHAELTTTAYQAAHEKCVSVVGDSDPACLAKNGFDGVKEVETWLPPPKNEKVRTLKLKMLDGKEIDFKQPSKYKAFRNAFYMRFEADHIHRIHMDDDQGEDAQTVEICVDAKSGKAAKCR